MFIRVLTLAGLITVLEFRGSTHVANCILHSSQRSSIGNYREAFSAYFRPVLGYYTQVWSSSMEKDIEIMEKPQRRFIKAASRRVFHESFKPTYE